MTPANAAETEHFNGAEGKEGNWLRGGETGGIGGVDGSGCLGGVGDFAIAGPRLHTESTCHLGMRRWRTLAEQDEDELAAGFE